MLIPIGWPAEKAEIWRNNFVCNSELKIHNQIYVCTYFLKCKQFWKISEAWRMWYELQIMVFCGNISTLFTFKLSADLYGNLGYKIFSFYTFLLVFLYIRTCVCSDLCKLKFEGFRDCICKILNNFLTVSLSLFIRFIMLD